MEPAVEIRQMDQIELARVAEIDRTERITVLYEQRGAELTERHGDWSSLPWETEGDGEHSVSRQISAVEQYIDAGGTAFGAFASERLVGMGVVVPHIRPSTAQLAFLHVSAPFRATGIGAGLCERLDSVARNAGDTAMVVSATPTGNTVRFYRSRGFAPMAQPVPELFELEPDDVHMHKLLSSEADAIQP